MSRVGKQPIEIPAGVTISVEGRVVSVKGAKSTESFTHGTGVSVLVKDGTANVELVEKHKQARANFGTTRAIIANMINGLGEGYKKTLILNGVGYTAKLQGDKLTLNTGYSHEVILDVPKGITCKVQKEQVDVEGADKQMVGQFSAKIRDVHPPEPYLGKGIRFQDEQVRRKAGKAGK